MPVHLIIWGLAALAGGWATGEVAKEVGHDKHREGEKILDGAKEYVDDRRKDYVLLRRHYLERLQSFAQMIFLAFSDSIYKTRPAPETLPEELQKIWLEIFEALDIRPAGKTSDGPLSEVSLNSMMKMSAHVSRTSPTQGAFGFVAVGIISAARGATELFDGIKFLNHAKAEAIKAKSSADLNLSSMKSALQRLDTDWDNTISPMITIAQTDGDKAAALLKIAEGFSNLACDLLKEE